jgi:hypothetical protein
MAEFLDSARGIDLLSLVIDAQLLEAAAKDVAPGMGLA